MRDIAKKKQGTPYKELNLTARFKNHYKIVGAEDATVILPISVGQIYHEGVKFQETLKLAAQFNKVIIVIADALQAKTIAIKNNSDNPNDFIDIALEKGREWYTRNIDAVYQYMHSDQVKFYHWCDFTTNETYLQARDAVEKLDREYSVFHNEVERSINIFLQRFYKSTKVDMESNAARLTRDYIMCETAVLQVWAREIQADYIAYPGKLYPAMYNYLQNFVYNETLGLLQFLEIDFKAIKISSNQHSLLTPNKKGTEQKITNFRQIMKQEGIKQEDLKNEIFQINQKILAEIQKANISVSLKPFLSSTFKIRLQEVAEIIDLASTDQENILFTI